MLRSEFKPGDISFEKKNTNHKMRNSFLLVEIRKDIWYEEISSHLILLVEGDGQISSIKRQL